MWKKVESSRYNNADPTVVNLKMGCWHTNIITVGNNQINDCKKTSYENFTIEMTKIHPDTYPCNHHNHTSTFLKKVGQHANRKKSSVQMIFFNIKQEKGSADR